MIGRFSKLGTYKELFDLKAVLRVALGGMLALVGFFLTGSESIPRFFGQALILASVCINGLPIIWGAVEGIRKKKINVDELVSLAVIASVISGEFLGAAVVSFVMILGALVEEATGESARQAIRSLIKITPKFATIISGDKEKERPISEIRIGDILLVKPGERVPVDGTVVGGMTSVDESSITGEPIPVEKGVDDPVYAGGLNQNGVLKVRANKIGEDSTLGRVIQLVSQAEAHQPESVGLIDRYAKWFTPAIIACAGLAWAVTGELDRAITVLIVGCPCALILAAPTAIVAAISRAAKSGVLVKGGQYIEEAAAANVVLFDKTGTLTEGDPRVDEIIPAHGFEEHFVLEQAACVEKNSTHPLARAVLKAAYYAKVGVQAAENLMTTIGLGVEGCVSGCTVGVGNAHMGGGEFSLPSPLKKSLKSVMERGATPLVVYRDNTPIGLLSVSDHVRPDAYGTICHLKALQVKRIGILSGDHTRSVKRVAETVGGIETWDNLKPQDKLDIIEELRKSDPNSKIMFVGDGINDAPALAAADVGIAMGAKGTEVALETADVALMNDDIGKLPFLIKLGRRTVSTIKWNIVFGLAFNAVAVLASGSGLLTPIMGAVVHNIGSVIVVLSSASIAFSQKNERSM
jgi:Cd2+/Zn2+-exporting ATPase